MSFEISSKLSTVAASPVLDTVTHSHAEVLEALGGSVWAVSNKDPGWGLPSNHILQIDPSCVEISDSS